MFGFWKKLLLQFLIKQCLVVKPNNLNKVTSNYVSFPV